MLSTASKILEHRSSHSYKFADEAYHRKQKDPLRSADEELIAMRKNVSHITEAKSREMIPDDCRDTYESIVQDLPKLRRNFQSYLCNQNKQVDEYKIDKDPILSKAQKRFYDLMMQSNIQDPTARQLFLKNGKNLNLVNTASSYSGSGSNPQFMIRALSYIFPMLIIQPLPKLTWREDWPIDEAGLFSELAVVVGAQRVYPKASATDGSESAITQAQGTNSPAVNATFGEQVFQAITLRNDIIWDSTIKKYQDEQLNGGLLNYMFMQSLKRGIDEQINQIYLSGSSLSGTTGLLNNTQIPTVVSAGPWPQQNTSTGELYATSDLINLLNAVEQNSLTAFQVTNLMMSLVLKPTVIQARSQYVSSSPLSYILGQFSADGTSYNQFEQPTERCRFNPYLNNQGTAGAQIAFAYQKDLECAKIGLPVPMYAEPISYENNRFRMPFVTRTFGFQLILPSSIAVMKNISNVP